MPDWLKDTGPKNPYADYQGEADRPGRGERGDRGPRGPRREGGPRGRGPGQGGERRGERPGGPGGPGRPGGREQGRPGGQRGPGDRPGRGPRREGRPGDRPFQGRESSAPVEEIKPAPVTVEFLPEPPFVASIAKLVRTSFRAYPLLELARGFISKSERYKVRITARQGDAPLYQVGENGPVALDRAVALKAGFVAFRSEYYSQETTEGEEIKGNFTNVARHRISGTLLGPTSHHGYQVALRRLYEERFSRRMSFEDFKRGIEIVTDPEVIAEWKQSARSTTVYKTLKEEEQKTFSEVAEVEQHFREHYAEKLIKTGHAFEVSGDHSRRLPDRSIGLAVRLAFEKQRGFPSQMIFHLRREFFAAGLHVFRVQKQAQFVAARHPTPFKGDKTSLKEGIASILRVLEANPRCTRNDLAASLLPASLTEEEAVKAKAELAADLHWLIHAGHVVEFSDGHMEVPTKDWDKPEQHGKEQPRQEGQKQKRQGQQRPQGPKPASTTEPAKAEPQTAEAPEAAKPVETPEEAAPQSQGAESAEPGELAAEAESSPVPTESSETPIPEESASAESEQSPE